MTGKVVMFNTNKGYGFISDENGHDIFFHCSQLIVPGQDYKTIEVGARVTFDVEESDRGFHATNIKEVEEK